MTITFEKTISVQKEIELPAFFRRDKNEVIAALSDKNFLSAYQCEGLVVVKNHDRLSDYEARDLTDENIITESEFMYHYNRALEFLSLQPKLKSVVELAETFHS